MITRKQKPKNSIFNTHSNRSFDMVLQVCENVSLGRLASWPVERSRVRCCPSFSRTSLLRECTRLSFRVCFLASYWSTGFGTFLLVSAFASHWLEDCANFTPTPEENNQYSANHSKCNKIIKSIHCYQWTIILHLWLAVMTKRSS